MDAKILAYRTDKKTLDFRMLAAIIDRLLIIIALFIVLNIVENIDIVLNYFLLILLIFIIYCIIFEFIFGATFGKMIFGLKVINSQCKKPNLLQCFIRTLFTLLEMNIFTFLLSYLVAKKSKFMQRIGDIIVKTYVVKKSDLKSFKNNNSINLLKFDEYTDYIRSKADDFKSNTYYNQYSNINKNDIKRKSLLPRYIYLLQGNKKLKVHGIENMSIEDVVCEIQNGGRFAVFYQCISFLIISQKTSSDIYFIKSGENHSKYSRKFSINTMIFGWWGFPWGLIWSVNCLNKNGSGGEDVTSYVVNSIIQEDYF